MHFLRNSIVAVENRNLYVTILCANRGWSASPIKFRRSPNYVRKIRKLKDRKGFTLVELIVVLVILAILAALLIPALTGYIDKANKDKVVAECRQVVVAAQTVASESYGQNKTINSASVKEIKELAEAPDSWNYAITIGDKNTVTSVVFTDGNTTVTYTKTPADGKETYELEGTAVSDRTVKVGTDEAIGEG